VDIRGKSKKGRDKDKMKSHSSTGGLQPKSKKGRNAKPTSKEDRIPFITTELEVEGGEGNEQDL